MRCGAAGYGVVFLVGWAWMMEAVEGVVVFVCGEVMYIFLTLFGPV